MKIIGTSNFDDESVSDTLVCENINEYLGEAVTVFLNDRFCAEFGRTFYKLVPDDYKLYKWEP